MSEMTELNDEDLDMEHEVLFDDRTTTPPDDNDAASAQGVEALNTGALFNRPVRWVV